MLGSSCDCLSLSICILHYEHRNNRNRQPEMCMIIEMGDVVDKDNTVALCHASNFTSIVRGRPPSITRRSADHSMDSREIGGGRRMLGRLGVYEDLKTEDAQL